ncbi:MAG: beta-lactamase domain protein [Alphaproteobacteria bacterium]|nr:beta-lactamase domain protein [Alphaproteobacteria bacterium]
MRIHHLNCACMCPVGGPLFDGFSKGPTASLICHCLLIESEQGLVLVDTGIGMGDINNPDRLSTFFKLFNNIQLKPEHTALYQINKLGFAASDVRHIVLTHLDFDHAGGIGDFPNATVHVLQSEWEATKNLEGFIRKRRYRPEQWSNVKEWKFYPDTGDNWFGFNSVRNLDGLPPEILFVPLAGHTPGHAGVAIDVDVDGWVFNAGDAYFFRHEMDQPDYHCTPGLRFYQWMMEESRSKRLHNQARLRHLMKLHGNDIKMFCSHDEIEYKHFHGAAA